MAIQEESAGLGQVDRAAMLVLTLDKNVLAGVMKHLNSTELTTLMQGYEHLIRNGMPSDDQLMSVGKTFLETGFVNPTTHFKEALVLAYGPESADQILRHDHWRMISERVKPEALAQVLRGERTEAMAIVLSQLPPRYAAEVLSALPEELRADVVEQLARSTSVPGRALDAILRAIEESFSRSVGMDDANANAGARRAAQMLNQLDSESATAIVEKIRSGDAKRATAIEQEMFHFQDFIKLDSRAQQTVLVECKPERLALALKGIKDDERDTVLGALPDQVKRIVEQEMEDIGKVPMRDVRAARREITDLAIQMDRDGKIKLRVDQDLIG
jgi:flagellar motor switch protein FliG